MYVTQRTDANDKLYEPYDMDHIICWNDLTPESEVSSFLDPYWKENIFLWFVILPNILEKAGNRWTTGTSLDGSDTTANAGR